MIRTCGGSLVLSFQQQIDSRQKMPVPVQIDARFANRSLVYQVPGTSAVGRELESLFNRLMRIESSVSSARAAHVGDLQTGAYPALGIVMTVRSLRRDGCELELEIADPGDRSASLHVLNGVAARFIDDFVENLMEGAVELNHPRNRSLLSQEPMELSIGPSAPRLTENGF